MKLISGLWNRASDKCQKENGKRICGDDLFWAMADLGFEDHIDPLKAFLIRYREDLRRNRSEYQEQSQLQYLRRTETGVTETKEKDRFNNNGWMNQKSEQEQSGNQSSGLSK